MQQTFEVTVQWYPKLGVFKYYLSVKATLKKWSEILEEIKNFQETTYF